MLKSKRYSLHDGLGYKLTLAARVNNQRFEARLAKLGLSRQMWCILIAVGEQGLSFPSDIAAYIGINRTAASRSLRHMEELGLLQRRSGTKDKRTTEVELTAKGTSARDASLPLAFETQAEQRQNLSPQEHQVLLELLDKFLGDAVPSVSGI
ncbi:MAG: winged helix-turn-helix transcriptional regulator [Rhodobacteraceae bacterium]|nr:winged helix-turn-helix transcriptional regulator [Paracoccaceae bacterium]